MINNIFKFKNQEWVLPLLFQYDAIWATIHNTLKDFSVELPKASLFGSPSILWAGGRVPRLYGKFNRKFFENWLAYVKEHNATPTFTFTSTKITQEDLKDEYANFILDIALEFNCNFIVYSDILKDYIKEKKPEAKITASVIKANCRFQGPNRIEEPTIENETNYYNKLLKEYDIVVVRPEYSEKTLAENPNLIDDLSRIEVLINQPCIRNCPKMPEHYKYLQNYNTMPNYGDSFRCIRMDMESSVLYKNNLIHEKETVEKLIENGINILKLQGRGTAISTLDLLLVLMDNIFIKDGNNQIILNSITDNLEYEINNLNQAINRQ